jgi:outer membrane biosynthesis protein TonB
VSRTSRRVSRPLIAVLAIVIVLGVFFTIHRLHKAPAAVARDTVPLVLPDDPAPAASRSTTPESAAQAHHDAPAITPVVTPAPPADSTTLVTQTPTEKVTADVIPVATRASDAQPTAHPATRDSEPEAEAEGNDSDGLNAWAHGTSHDSTLTAHDATSGPSGPRAVAHDAAPPAHSQLSGQPVADAKARIDSGDLLGARQILNDALIGGSPDADAIKKQIEEINQTLIFSARKFPDDSWGGTYQVLSGERLATIAARHAVSWELLSRINGVTPKRLRSGQTIKVFKGPFYAIVYKHLFRMELYLGAPGGAGSMYVRSFQVGLGKDNSTPTGLWMCKAGDKIRNPRYYPPRGGDVIAPDDPKNPLGGYWIAIEGVDGQALGKESYGIHGTIDPNSIGKMESMGCIRLRADDISWVFDLLVDGKSKVLIKD